MTTPCGCQRGRRYQVERRGIRSTRRTFRPIRFSQEGNLLAVSLWGGSFDIRRLDSQFPDHGRRSKAPISNLNTAIFSGGRSLASRRVIDRIENQP